MSFVLVALALAAGPADQTTAAQPRPYHQISRDLQHWIKQQRQAQTSAERSEAVRKLADLYLELKQDPRLARSPTLQQYRAKLWSRLKQIERQLKREGVAPSAADRHRVSRAQRQPAAQQVAEKPDAGGARGGGAMRDYGDDLVRLIQRVIEPDFWDVNGGPGTIVYYRPLKALVVRATTEVHERIGGTLEGLRAAGR